MSRDTVFHTTAPDWFDKVRDLRPGGKRRIGDALLASFNGKAYHLWSFRDHTSEVYAPQLSLAERLAIATEKGAADGEAVASRFLPQPQMKHPQDWPVEARAWMHKAGINNDDIRRMGAYWNPRMQRVVVPYVAADGMSAWIARDPFPPSGRTKYLFPRETRRGGGALYSGDNDRPIVVTEDVLSAYRVHRASGHTAVAAQGVTLDRDALVRIRGSGVITWLDPDIYGQDGARRIRASMSRLGDLTANIRLDRDPKYYSDEDIRMYVRDAEERLE